MRNQLAMLHRSLLWKKLADPRKETLMDPSWASGYSGITEWPLREGQTGTVVADVDTQWRVQESTAPRESEEVHRGVLYSLLYAASFDPTRYQTCAKPWEYKKNITKQKTLSYGLFPRGTHSPVYATEPWAYYWSIKYVSTRQMYIQATVEA